MDQDPERGNARQEGMDVVSSLEQRVASLGDVMEKRSPLQQILLIRAESLLVDWVLDRSEEDVDRMDADALLVIAAQGAPHVEWDLLFQLLLDGWEDLLLNAAVQVFTVNVPELVNADELTVVINGVQRLRKVGVEVSELGHFGLVVCLENEAFEGVGR